LKKLKDILSSEKQLVRALPKLAQDRINPDLKAGFEEHLNRPQPCQRIERSLNCW